MTTKVIYFKVGVRNERAEFRDDFPADDVKGKYTVTSYIVTHYFYTVITLKQKIYAGVIHKVTIKHQQKSDS